MVTVEQMPSAAPMVPDDEHGSGPGDCICWYGAGEIENTCPEHGAGGRLRAATLRGKAGPSSGAAPRVDRLYSLLEEAAAMIDKHVPDLCGSRGVLTSKIRDAIKGKWDEGEWEEETPFTSSEGQEK